MYNLDEELKQVILIHYRKIIRESLDLMNNSGFDVGKLHLFSFNKYPYNKFNLVSSD
jgi:hypothetical protein